MNRKDSFCYTEPDIFITADERRVVKVGMLEFRMICNGSPDRPHRQYFAIVYHYNMPFAKAPNLTAEQGDPLRAAVDEVVYKRTKEYGWNELSKLISEK